MAAFKAHGAHVIIGTPGRIDDVMKRLGGAMETKRLEVSPLIQRPMGKGGWDNSDAVRGQQRRSGRT